MSTSSKPKPKVRVVESPWVIGAGKVIQKPTPRTQSAFDAHVRAFYENEPYISLPTSQRNKIKAYFQEMATAQGWTMPTGRKKPVPRAKAETEAETVD